jgi:hypothetical protein
VPKKINDNLANVHDCNFKRPFVTTIDSKASSLNFTQLIFNGAPSYAILTLEDKIWMKYVPQRCNNLKKKKKKKPLKKKNLTMFPNGTVSK